MSDNLPTPTEGLLSAFNKNPSEWDIVESSYKGGQPGGQVVVFHVFQSNLPYGGALPRVNDSGGRRKIKLAFPYTDGQTLDDMGRRGNRFELEIVFFGPAYMKGFNDLMKQLDQPQPGRLLHPVRGPLTCGMDTYGVEHSNEMRQAMVFRVVLEEHNFKAATLKDITIAKTVPGALSTALSALQALNQAIVSVQAAIKLVASVKAAILQGLQNLRDFFQSLLADFNSLFNDTGSNGNGTTFPGLAPTNTGGLLQPVAASATATAGNNFNPSTTRTAGVAGTSLLPGGYILVGTRAPTVIAPTDPFANIPTSLLSPTAREALAVSQLTQNTELMRGMANSVIALMEAANSGQGSVQMRDIILAVTRACLNAQTVLEAGVASSRARVITYTVPVGQVMSIREIAFVNGLTPDDALDVELINPELESVNFIAAGTQLKVPVST